MQVADWSTKFKALRSYGLDTGTAVEVALDAEQGDPKACDTLNKALRFACDKMTDRAQSA